MSTFRERDSNSGRRVRVFVYVLRYDDLIADASSSFTIDDNALPLHIGRASDDGPTRLVSASRLVVPDRWASTDHCRVQYVGTSDVIHDEASRNGTFVNGERVERYRVLNDGDLIEVGHAVFCYRNVDAHAASALADAPDDPATTTHNAEMATIVRDLRLLAPSREPVLLLGDAGAGKEVLARAVHAWSVRKGPLHVVDCGAVTDGAREAALAADGATVLLDDVERLNDAAQATLLRAIESGRGAKAEARWIATSTRELFNASTSLRADLLRSLGGYVARVPPLRRRREDLGVLASRLLRAAGFERAAITPAAGRALFLSGFAGNVRQLRTVLRASATLAGSGPIDLRHLPPLDVIDAPPSRASGRSDTVGAVDRGSRRAPTLEEITNALEATRGNIVRAAECLGTHPRQVYRWIERHEISLERFRQ